MKTSFPFVDVSMPLLVTYLNQASLLSSVKSYVDLRMETKKDAFKIDWTMCSSVVNCSRINNENNWENLCDHLQRARTFTFI